jgi:hypothetical protein
VTAERAVAVRTRHQARPGRRVIVIADLASLHGPVTSMVRLPLWLYWSGPSPALDLAEPFLRQWLYQIVLREAVIPEDLTTYLDAGLLITAWPELYLPKGARRAWEELHAALRPPVAAPADAGQRPAPPGQPSQAPPPLSPSSPGTRGRG